MDNEPLLELVYEQYETVDFLELIKKYNLNYIEVLNHLKEKPDFTGEVIYEGKRVNVEFFLYSYQKERSKFTVKRYWNLLQSKDETPFSEAENPAIKTLYEVTAKRNDYLQQIEELNESIEQNKASTLDYIHKHIHTFDFLPLVKMGAITFDEVEAYLKSHIKDPIYVKMKDNILLLSRVKFLWYLIDLNLANTTELLTKLEVLKDICDFTDILAYSKRIDLPILLTVYYLESVLDLNTMVQCGRDRVPIHQLRETLLEGEQLVTS